MAKIAPFQVSPTPAPVKRLPPLQRAGMWLAAGVGGLILYVTVTSIVMWKSQLPPVPNLAASPAHAKDAIEHYKALSTLVQDNALKMFDQVVGRALLPVFTGILGYIFGSRAESREA